MIQQSVLQNEKIKANYINAAKIFENLYMQSNFPK